MIASTRWVFDVKLGLDGWIDHFKARLVARENKQSDSDFDEIFALVFRLDSLQILIAIAARYGMVAHMLDALNAFVRSDLDKPNCMKIPEGLQDFDPDATGQWHDSRTEEVTVWIAAVRESMASEDQPILDEDRI